MKRKIVMKHWIKVLFDIFITCVKIDLIQYGGLTFIQNGGMFKVMTDTGGILF